MGGGLMDALNNTLNINISNRICVVEMNRPEALNAFSNKLMDDLADTFLAVAADPGINVLVLTGAGRAFSAGADLQEMGSATVQPKHGFPGLLDAIFAFPKPFMIAVNGVGAGIGATICGLADLVYISDQARLRCPFSSLGLTAEAASTYTFPRLMGRQQASWFLLSSEWMSAAQCVDAGLALELCTAEQLLPRTLEQAGKLAALPSASLQKTKSLMMQHTRAEMEAAAKAENAGLASLMGGPANKEALAAFREKRDADFSKLA